MLLDLGDIVVRRWRRDDLDALLRYANNPKIAANLRDQFPHPYTRRDGIEYLNYARTMETVTSFAIEYGGEAIGGIGFKLGNDIARLSAEMGYWLAEPFWGRGLTTRAVAATCDWAFDGYKVVRIFALAFIHNTASMRVLEKCGFRRKACCARARSRTAWCLTRRCTRSCVAGILERRAKLHPGAGWSHLILAVLKSHSERPMEHDKQLREQIAKVIDWKEAHADLAAAVEDFPDELRGKIAPGMPYSAWQLLEHIRIALWDIVEFCRIRGTNLRHGPRATGRRLRRRRARQRGSRASVRFESTWMICVS